MATPNPAIQKLRQLGLTRTEAEVYLATLQQATGGPVSAYKVAQAMGRDPANLGKNLSALEKRGAVRVIQAKPRLYLPISPADFADELLQNMQKIGDDLVTHLEGFQGPEPSGLNLALRNNQQALDQASQLLENCQKELQIFTTREVIDYLGKDFGKLASRTNCKIKFLGTTESGIALAHDTIIPMPIGFPEHQQYPWLYMIVDERTWLVAQFNRPDETDFPCGWWGDDPVFARIFSAVFAQASQYPEYEFKNPETGLPDRVRDTENQEPQKAQNGEAFDQGVFGALGQAEESHEEEKEGAESRDSDGLQFVVKHEKEQED